ncbi:MAG: type II secretion system protein [Phycisphaerae bacterium]|nr:type II secretion system protein [Phycisphaerae bacterium]
MTKKAFTLIELLVVISIISILMAILMPSLQKVRYQAKSLVCNSNLRQWGIMLTAYTNDYDGRFFEGWYEGCSNNGVWVFVMEKYYAADPEVRCCPLAKNPDAENPYKAWGYLDNRFYGSYGMNSWLYDPPRTVKETEGHHTILNWRRLAIKKGYQVPMLMDSQWIDGWPEHYDIPPTSAGQDWLEDDGHNKNHMRRFCINRHVGNVNSIFVDLHLEKLGLKQMWRTKWHQRFSFSEPLPAWPEWMEKFKDPK